LAWLAKQVATGGADILQLRDKGSSRHQVLARALSLRGALQHSRTLFIVNDFIDVAKIACCDGVHIGQDDVSVVVARRILGPDKVIGVSCSNLSQALSAERLGADYIGMGAIFSTATKHDAGRITVASAIRVQKHLSIPLFVLGGITVHNLGQLITQGLRRVAVCRDICLAENSTERTRGMRRMLYTN
jgi:thiamine-phosphate pyrophosphorylase